MGKWGHAFSADASSERANRRRSPLDERTHQLIQFMSCWTMVRLWPIRREWTMPRRACSRRARAREHARSKCSVFYEDAANLPPPGASLMRRSQAVHGCKPTEKAFTALAMRPRLCTSKPDAMANVNSSTIFYPRIVLPWILSMACHASFNDWATHTHRAVGLESRCLVVGTSPWARVSNRVCSLRTPRDRSCSGACGYPYGRMANWAEASPSRPLSPFTLPDKPPGPPRPPTPDRSVVPCTAIGCAPWNTTA
jgi:hypothetical protein